MELLDELEAMRPATLTRWDHIKTDLRPIWEYKYVLQKCWESDIETLDPIIIADMAPECLLNFRGILNSKYEKDFTQHPHGPNNIGHCLSYSHLTKHMEFLRKHPDMIFWSGLSENRSDEAVNLLLENKERICYSSLSANTNPRIFPLLEENIAKGLCPKMEDYQNAHPDFNFTNFEHNQLFTEWYMEISTRFVNWVNLSVNWVNLSENSSDYALDILEKYPEKIYWNQILNNKNSRAKALFQTLSEADQQVYLEEYVPSYNRIRNPFYTLDEKYAYISSIFRDEYESAAREYFRGPVSEEMMAKVWAPANISRFADWGIDDDA